MFYRIYVKPSSSKFYEIFKCNRWEESAKVRITHVNMPRKKTNSFVINMRPKVPVTFDVFTLTFSSVTVPPIPMLNTPFVSDRINTALRDANLIPSLQCENEAAAQKLDCETKEQCVCYPAETKANCNCKNMNIAGWFQDVQNHLPVVLLSVSFRSNKEGEVQAVKATMTAADVILNLQDQFNTTITVIEAQCTIQIRL